MEINKDYTSVIIASYIPNEMRAHMFRRSLDSLLKTTAHLPVEIIVTDNGGSEYADGKVNTYIKNRENMHFGFARNQAVACAKGNYICMADNDIEYLPGWLDQCLEVFKQYPEEKYWATPIQYVESMADRYSAGTLEVGDKTYRKNYRAGSNCLVMKADDFRANGEFICHRIAGSHWNDTCARNGYMGIVTPVDMVKDLGLRLGYNLKESIPIKRTLTDGSEVYFNEDEYRKKNPDKQYYDHKRR